ncbi:MAG: hypothetical protein IJE68_00340 [Clostridia bacterium]|nr:hypothetical protein [Clostridia bacterium]
MRDFEGKKERMKLNSEKIRDRERKLKVVKMSILIMLMSLIIMYFLLRIVFESGYFTISLDPAFAQESGLVMYEKISEKYERKILKATRVDFMDNISVKWLPENIHEMGEGSHNGKNYLAYTFYLENMGSDTINYWYQIIVDDVIKNVDKAIRIMIYRNGERTIYARPNEATGNAENGTEKFYSDLEPVLESRKGFEPGQIDKFTVVIYLEGDDPDCIDALIGGEMKMHMDITEEHITKTN